VNSVKRNLDIGMLPSVDRQKWLCLWDSSCQYQLKGTHLGYWREDIVGRLPRTSTMKQNINSYETDAATPSRLRSPSLSFPQIFAALVQLTFLAAVILSPQVIAEPVRTPASSAGSQSMEPISIVDSSLHIVRRRLLWQYDGRLLPGDLNHIGGTRLWRRVGCRP